MSTLEDFNTHKAKLDQLAKRQHELSDQIKAGNTEAYKEFSRNVLEAESEALFVSAYGIAHLVESQTVEIKFAAPSFVSRDQLFA